MKLTRMIGALVCATFASLALSTAGFAQTAPGDGDDPPANPCSEHNSHTTECQEEIDPADNQTEWVGGGGDTYNGGNLGADAYAWGYLDGFARNALCSSNSFGHTCIIRLYDNTSPRSQSFACSGGGPAGELGGNTVCRRSVPGGGTTYWMDWNGWYQVTRN